MAGHKPEDEISLQGGKRSQKIREIHVQPQILAVGIDVLAQKGDVPIALGNHLPDLRLHILRPAAPFPATDVGDDAVGAEVVAAVHDADPALELAQPFHRKPLGNVAGLRGDELALSAGEGVKENFRQLPLGVGGEDPVHVGVALFEP